jgi:hypothetical protein
VMLTKDPLGTVFRVVAIKQRFRDISHSLRDPA